MSEIVDEDGVKRIPSMKAQRIKDDLPEIIAASYALINGDHTYEESMKRHFDKMHRFYSGKDRVGAFDDLQKDYLNISD